MDASQDQILTNAVEKARYINLSHKENERTLQRAYENTLVHSNADLTVTYMLYSDFHSFNVRDTTLVETSLNALINSGHKVSKKHNGFTVSDHGNINFTGVAL